MKSKEAEMYLSEAKTSHYELQKVEVDPVAVIKLKKQYDDNEIR